MPLLLFVVLFLLTPTTTTSGPLPSFLPSALLRLPFDLDEAFAEDALFFSFVDVGLCVFAVRARFDLRVSGFSSAANANDADEASTEGLGGAVAEVALEALAERRLPLDGFFFVLMAVDMLISLLLSFKVQHVPCEKWWQDVSCESESEEVLLRSIDCLLCPCFIEARACSLALSMLSKRARDRLL